MTEEKLCDGCVHQPGDKDGTYPETCCSCSRWYGDGYEKKDEPIYYYQWETQVAGKIHTTDYMTDVFVEKQTRYKENNYRRVDSSKRTWKDLS